MRTLGGRYVLHEVLGQGTTGEVWRASRRDDGAAVAVKTLRPEFTNDPVVVDRFLREWRILYDLDSPGLVRVLDLVNEPDALAIVMELVDGPDLREYLRRAGPLSTDEAVRIVADMLFALDTVHAAGVVHRDVKPENVLLDGIGGPNPMVRLTDFGIARMVDNPSRAPATGPIGTPLYMAPELGLGEAPTPATDIYSAGVVLYELLAGNPPFDEANPADMLRAHREERPLPIRGVPEPVWDVLAAMLAKQPKHRPRSAAETAHALLDALDRRRDRDRDWEPDRDRHWDDAATQLGPRVDARQLAAVGAGAGAAVAAGAGMARASHHDPYYDGRGDQYGNYGGHSGPPH
ncbi:MAG: serine/threonine protein kinase, partial [Frankia sp.]|nr:serine/threonine protein kinase [Frankia sp.]